jgi:hypothetical protein
MVDLGALGHGISADKSLSLTLNNPNFLYQFVFKFKINSKYDPKKSKTT